MTQVHPLIICGGTGTRLWPLSRAESPKQFQKVAGPESLTFFQTAVQRHLGALYHRPCIVTGQMHRATAAEQLAELQVDGRMICEPMGRNTGPAVLAAAMSLIAEDPDAVMIVIPADHVIHGPLNDAVSRAIPAVRDGHIVTFGVAPRYAETGFGYITDAGPLGDFDGVRQIGQFIEKPPKDEAQRLIDSRAAYWASGLSMFRADVLIEEYRRFDSETVADVEYAVSEGQNRDGTLFLHELSFARAAAKPTEQVVFEHSDRMALMPMNVTWDDVGSWLAMYDIAAHDRDGNVLQGDVIAHDAQNTMVRADSRLVSVVGLSDVVVIDTPDALLVARKDRTQNVKDVVEQLKARGRAEARRHQTTGPTMVQLPEPAALERITQTDQFQLGTAQIQVGRSSQLERGPVTRQVIIVKGRVQAIGPDWSKTVAEGGRIYADETGAVRLINQGDAPAELLHLTLAPGGLSSDSVPLASNA